MIILDTDHISVLQHEDSPKTVGLLEKLESLPPEEVATTVATLEEQSRSWLSLIGRYSDVRQQVEGADRESEQGPHRGGQRDAAGRVLGDQHPAGGHDASRHSGRRAVVKKWDWLRAETTKTLENQRSRRCLSQFFTASERLDGQRTFFPNMGLHFNHQQEEQRT
jgi:hypothetical protein